jgi:hypothetical protein
MTASINLRMKSPPKWRRNRPFLVFLGSVVAANRHPNN